MSVPFLLEIGTEEIPDWMIPPAVKQLEELFQDLLDRTKLGGTISSVDATPRRFVVRIERIADRQPDADLSCMPREAMKHRRHFGEDTVALSRLVARVKRRQFD